MDGTRFRTALLLTGTLAVAAILGGCAGPRPLSVEEKLWFNKATGVYQAPGVIVLTPHGPRMFDPEPEPGPRPPLPRYR